MSFVAITFENNARVDTHTIQNNYTTPGQAHYKGIKNQ